MSLAELPSANINNDEQLPEAGESRLGRYELHQVDTRDDYISDTLTFERINTELNELSAMGFRGDSSIDLDRKRKGSIDRSNPATAALIEKLPTFSDWLDLVPTAAALDSLYDPHKETLANGKPLSPELAEWFCNIVDGRGIRSRAEIVRTIMSEEALAHDGQPRWLSLASGAAQPIIKTAALLGEQHGTVPAITLVDRDNGSLKLAREYAAQAGIESHVQTRNINILQPKGIDRPVRAYDELMSEDTVSPGGLSIRSLARRVRDGNRLPEDFYDTVEVVGLTEYLLEDDWKYTYSKVIKTALPMAGARSFLHNAYRLVKPGGSLIVGNMLDTHPQLGFTLNVIQWPHIQPRSIDDMMGIFDTAGLDGQTDVYTAPDGAYAIYRIKKEA